MPHQHLETASLSGLTITGGNTSDGNGGSGVSNDFGTLTAAASVRSGGCPGWRGFPSSALFSTFRTRRGKREA
jgi:hypothetical protein